MSLKPTWPVTRSLGMNWVKALLAGGADGMLIPATEND